MIPVVLSGGDGTRLWPVSRKSHPKQFCALFDESLHFKTLKRLLPLGSPWVLTTESLKTLTIQVLEDLNIPTDQVIYEPFGRNTGPAIALLCRCLEIQNKTDEVVGVFPADQFIEKQELFVKAIKLAKKCADKVDIVTLGIKPTYAATGYGYIETSTDQLQSEGAFRAMKVKGFREKPDSKTAEEFLASSRFNWNAGIFVFKVSSLIATFKALQPQLWLQISEVKEDLSNLKEVYGSLNKISFDHAIMELCQNQACIPVDLGWSDVGSWDEVKKLQKSSEENTLVEVEAQNNFVFSTKKNDKVYGVIGLKDLFIVDTEDALLVGQEGHSQKVKEVMAELIEKGKTQSVTHTFESRPWGRFEVLRDEESFKSKKVTIWPQSQLSYQSHSKRSEHWIISHGSGEVVLDDKVIPVKKGDHVRIPQGAKHRARNNTDTILEFIEVQLGSYFGEDDIVRYQDDYDRT